VTNPVWQYVSDDEPDETYVLPVAELPTESLENRIVGAEVELANGSHVWALLGNVAVADARQTRHFLTLSVFVRDEWFQLARYHDLDYDERGPAKLAEVLELTLDEVFPIRYDMGNWVSGAAADTVRGTLHAVPPERLSRTELIKLAEAGT